MAIEGDENGRSLLQPRDHQPALALDAVELFDPLLEAVCQQLGAAADREQLFACLDAVLATGGRYAALPLAPLGFSDSMRVELARQARVIGQDIAARARGINAGGHSIARYGVERLRALRLRSHCEGHSWTEAVVAQLMGPAGGPEVMQLYNEWLHQLVLLRDALLPFENWRDVPSPSHLFGGDGLRALETARARFLTDLLTRRISFASISSWAQAVMGVDPLGDAYGFQVEGGTALPSAAHGRIRSAPAGLFTWRDGTLPGLDVGATVRFLHATSDYYALSRSDVSEIVAGGGGDVDDARILAERRDDGDAGLAIVVCIGARDQRVDLGQALRGHRFAYRVASSGAIPAPLAPERVVDIAPAALLERPGLVAAEAGVFSVTTDDDGLILLALLGKILPENVILPAVDVPLAAALAAGKGFGAKFIIGAAVDRVESAAVQGDAVSGRTLS